ncbi:MAG: Gfo/Idh/MocA family protein, partial [Armatimonadota bacterium]
RSASDGGLHMVRVGIVGAGFMGNTHAQCYQLIPKATLVGVADPVAKSRKQFAAQYGCEAYDTLEDMLAADVDAVDICTPTFLHAEQTVAAARAGKHIVCEKPMALTLRECDRMIAAARKARVVFMVAQVLRFWPEYVYIADLVRSGKLGRVHWAEANRLAPAPGWSWDDWIRDAERSGGPILDLHIHDLDFLAWLLGPPKRVFCSGIEGKGSHRSKLLTTVFTCLEGHRRGARSLATASTGMKGDFPFTMGLLISAEKGTIAFDATRDPALTVMEEGKKPKHPKVPQPKVPKSAYGRGNIEALGGYYVELKYFVDCIEKGEKPTTVTPQDARLAVELCLAARKSAQTGKAMRVASTVG